MWRCKDAARPPAALCPGGRVPGLLQTPPRPPCYVLTPPAFHMGLLLTLPPFFSSTLPTPFLTAPARCQPPPPAPAAAAPPPPRGSGSVGPGGRACPDPSPFFLPFFLWHMPSERMLRPRRGAPLRLVCSPAQYSPGSKAQGSAWGGSRCVGLLAGRGGGGVLEAGGRGGTSSPSCLPAPTSLSACCPITPRPPLPPHRPTHRLALASSSPSALPLLPLDTRSSPPSLPPPARPFVLAPHGALAPCIPSKQGARLPPPPPAPAPLAPLPTLPRPPLARYNLPAICLPS